MSTPYFYQGWAQSALPATMDNYPICYPIRNVSTVDQGSYQQPSSESSVEGLGIVCPSAPGQVPDNSTVNGAYDKPMWQRQIGSDTLHFQVSYEQGRNPTESACAPLPAVHTPYVSYPAPPMEATRDANISEQHTMEFLGAAINHTQAPSISGIYEPYHACVQPVSFQDLDSSTGHHNMPTGHLGHNSSSQQFQPFGTLDLHSSRRQSPSAQSTPYVSSTMFHIPHLQPSAEIPDFFSRRLSMSSNAPSSMVSGDCRDTPYLMTPSSTPQFAPKMSLGESSTLSSPSYAAHSRSPSSTSLKPHTPTFRPIRPAPYTLDAAQRQRWSTGKTMSLPSRRTQPPDFSFAPGHMRAVSEHNVNNKYFDDNFGSGDRTSFNESLAIIRKGLPTIVPSIENDAPERRTTSPETPSSSSHRPKLATIQPKAQRPISLFSLPCIPPLNLPTQSQPASPPTSPAPHPSTKENHVSPYDTYTPKYSRGTKGQLEGFCGLCKPGRWLNMKTSAYWYDKKNNHGINPKTKQAFDLPVERRWKTGSSVIREGLCGVCHVWNAMDSCKTSWRKWWRHAYECHNKRPGLECDGEKEQTSFDSGYVQFPNDFACHSVPAQYAGYMPDSWRYPQAPDAFYSVPNYPFWQG